MVDGGDSRLAATKDLGNVLELDHVWLAAFRRLLSVLERKRLDDLPLHMIQPPEVRLYAHLRAVHDEARDLRAQAGLLESLATADNAGQARQIDAALFPDLIAHAVDVVLVQEQQLQGELVAKG